MYAGGSQLNWIAHVRFIVLPAPTYNSGPPKIDAVGTEIYLKKFLSTTFHRIIGEIFFIFFRHGTNYFIIYNKIH